MTILYKKKRKKLTKLKYTHTHTHNHLSHSNSFTLVISSIVWPDILLDPHRTIFHPIPGGGDVQNHCEMMRRDKEKRKEERNIKPLILSSRPLIFYSHNDNYVKVDSNEQSIEPGNWLVNV